MSRKAKLMASVVIMGVCIASGSMASGIQAEDTYETNPLVLKEYDRLHIEVPVAADLAVMNVRVFGPGNELLLNTRTFGDAVEFLASSDLPDGEYRYETVSIFSNVDLRSRETAAGGGEKSMLRKFGSFRILNGQLVEQNAPPPKNSTSFIDKFIDQAVDLAGVTLDFFVPSAQAANVSTAPGGDILIESDKPLLRFLYGPDNAINDGTEEWIISAFQGADPSKGNFNIYDRSNDRNVLTFEQGDGILNQDSINVDNDGDIHWAEGGLNFDKGESGLSIGTTLSGAELIASAIEPEIRLRDETYDDFMFTSYDTYFYNIGYSSTKIARLAFNAPGESLLLDPWGNLGIGTSSSNLPAASLEVRRNDGTASILVDEQSATSETRNLFTLQNKGLTKFIINNLDGAEWAFANKGTSFRISRQGSGVVEMEVFNNGNVTIQGALTQNSDVNQKTNIKPVDQRSVLQRITDMPISQWQYKDALGENHIGPMAQDFYTAFGLGNTDTGLSTIDTAGVALVAIQALAEDNKVLAEENQALREQVQDQQARLDALENHQLEMQAMVTSLLEAQKAAPVLTKTAMN